MASRHTKRLSKRPRTTAAPNSIGSYLERRSVRGGSIVSRSSHHSRRNNSVRDASDGGCDDYSVISRQSLRSTSSSIRALPRDIDFDDDDCDDDCEHDVPTTFSRNDSSHGGNTISGRSRASIVSNGSTRTNHSSSCVQSLATPSIKSLPREIELVDDDATDDIHTVTSGVCSISLTSASNHSSRTDDTRSTITSRPTRRRIRKESLRTQENSSINSSTDTFVVRDKVLMDPYGETGLYTGSLSRSTNFPHGKGRFEYENESRWYEGDWIHGRWSGHGKLSNRYGDYYMGGFKNDHIHGTGTMRFADGRVFEGEYIRDQMIRGQMTYQDGSIYKGSWVGGMRHGRGRLLFFDGSHYEGEFRAGNFDGHGKLVWNDGGYYSGNWTEGVIDGMGMEVRADGTLRHDGEWSRGRPVRRKTQPPLDH